MNIETVAHDGARVTYGFDPQHAAALVAYYDGLVQSGEIATYSVITNALGIAIRSVLVEARTWRDKTPGNNYTAAYLWVNGRPIGSFGFQYGSPEMLEHYALEPYLERVGVIPPAEPGTHTPHLRYRLAALGVDYYLTQSTTLRRGLWKITELPEAADFADAVAPMSDKISQAPAKDPNSGGRQNAGI